MAIYSVAEARDKLSSLIEQAERGETVTITKHGRPVAELRGVNVAGRAMSPADIAWLDSVRVTPRTLDDHPVSIVERMRDEDEERLLRR